MNARERWLLGSLALVFLALVPAYKLSREWKHSRVVIETRVEHEDRVVQVFGGTIVVEPYEDQDFPEYLTAGFFLAAGAVCLFTALLLTGAAAPPAGSAQSPLPWLVFGTGLVYLAADETFMVHELIGKNVGWLAHLAAALHVHEPDDLIMASYGPAALAVLWTWRKVFLAERGPLLVLIAAAGCTGISIVGDALGNQAGIPEEFLEVTGAFLTLTAMSWYALRQLAAGPTSSSIASREPS